MVPNVSQARLLMLFIEGMMELLHGWVKAFKPSNLQEGIWRTRDLMGSASKTKFTPRPPIKQKGRDQRGVDKGKGRMDKTTRRELKRKQLCFTCKETWEPGHQCMGKGKAHYIEVISDDEEEEDFSHIQNMKANPPRIDPTENEEGEEAGFDLTGDRKATIASINGVPKFNTFRMRGVLQGQKVSVLINVGASHNFIDSALLKRRHIPTVEFEGFPVEVAGRRTMPCDRYIPGMKLTLGRHDLAQDFTTNYKTMEMSFIEENRKKSDTKRDDR
jgi:hypothetical protein